VRGAPSYPPLMMFKILILQAWYNLSKTRAQLIAMSHNLKKLPILFSTLAIFQKKAQNFRIFP
jgi:transposase